jgi:hypothetical protein
LLLVQCRGAMAPNFGMRWTLRAIFETGIILTTLSWDRAVDRLILYMPCLESGIEGKGVNHSTYARCLGNWLVEGSNHCTAVAGMEKMTRI